MKNFFPKVFILFLLFWPVFSSFAEEEKTYTTYQLEHRDVTIKEAQDVISRSVGSGTVDVTRGETLWKWIQSQWNSWVSSHSGAKVMGGVPFYWPRNLVVAYEYYLQCGDTICGSIYDVFPWKTSMDEIMDLFVKRNKCLEIYGCNFPQNYYAILSKSGKIWHFWTQTAEELQDTYIVWPTIEPMLVPDAVPTSIRLAESIPEGKMKFFHGIYAIRGKDLKVISLDPRDKDLSILELKKRLIGLVDFSMQSPTIPLIYERARVREVWKWPVVWVSTYSFEEQRENEKSFQCIRVNENTKLQYAWNFYEPMCKWLPSRIPLFLWNYSIMNYQSVDFLTGRVANNIAPGMISHPYPTYLNFSL